MRRLVVLLTLSVGFLAPLAVSVAEAASPETVQATSQSSACRRKRAKKPQGESKKKDKKPYGFEL